MQTHHRTRVEIVVAKPLLGRLVALIDALPEIHGYTVLPCLGGRGSHGGREPEPLTDALAAVCVVVITREAPARALLEQAVERLGDHIGVASLSEVQVVRGGRF
jgi:hypothetical protein